MKILQLNLNHCAVAQDILAQSVREWEADLAIICEQHRNRDDTAWVSDLHNKAAIWACGKHSFQQVMTRPGAGFVWVKINGVYIYSCYASPNATMDEFEQFLDRLVYDARGRSPLVIERDFNA